MIEWRNEGNNALDYNEQQANEDGDQNVDISQMVTYLICDLRKEFFQKSSSKV